jgi:hypothetical protein
MLTSPLLPGLSRGSPPKFYMRFLSLPYIHMLSPSQTLRFHYPNNSFQILSQLKPWKKLRHHTGVCVCVCVPNSAERYEAKDKTSYHILPVCARQDNERTVPMGMVMYLIPNSRPQNLSSSTRRPCHGRGNHRKWISEMQNSLLLCSDRVCIKKSMRPSGAHAYFRTQEVMAACRTTNGVRSLWHTIPS